MALVGFLNSRHSSLSKISIVMTRIHLTVKTTPTLLVRAPISYPDSSRVIEPPTVLSYLNLLVKINILSYLDLRFAPTTVFILFPFFQRVLHEVWIGLQEPILLPSWLGIIFVTPGTLVFQQYDKPQCSIVFILYSNSNLQCSMPK